MEMMCPRMNPLIMVLPSIRPHARLPESQVSLSFRPEPAEDSSHEERINETVDVGFESGSPGPAVPDRVLPESEGVTGERGGAHEPEDGEVRRAGLQRPPRDVCGEDSDHDTIEKPECER